MMTRNRFMKKLISVLLALALIAGYTAAYPLSAVAAASGQSLGPVTSKDVIYQILTDRFYDGDGVLYEPDRDSSGQYVFDPDGNPIDYGGDGQVENKIADILNDTNGFFHHEGNGPDNDTSKFGYRHKELASLADYSQENGVVIEHLEKAGKF
ncbi:hypothetical protein [Paenibacillus dendritiformis]|uniref:hypothetical protein n=1 Tax=Paenibacillus dendritiformis TaxID=130049 RepID=UPI0018CEB47C|nr:hypothetical protein [Paenibacillus dendritiformis]